MNPLFGRKGQAKPVSTKIFYVTDVHGSGVAYRKLLNSVAAYGCKHIVMGGDVTGKMLIPIVTDSSGAKRATLHGERRLLTTPAEEEKFLAVLDMLGFYHCRLTDEEFASFQGQTGKVEELFDSVAYQRLVDWMRLAGERLTGAGVRLYISGGNDDSAEALRALEDHETEWVMPCEHRKIELDDRYTMVSLGISNPTPWDTPREYPEEVIAEKIEEAVAGLDDFTHVIFNFHVPPYDCTLDVCPELDTSKDPPAPVMRGGQQVFIPVGSTAVRDAVMRYQPLLVLCGHIHESRGVARLGRTTVINPGSEYGEGVLRGIIINLRGDQVFSYQMTSG